jgi:hypothetical protein
MKCGETGDPQTLLRRMQNGTTVLENNLVASSTG